MEKENIDYSLIIENSPLVKKLKVESDKDTVRFHMPGHKATELPFLKSCVDFTEYDDTDNLYNPSGVILEAEKRASAAFGAKYTLFSPGGATLALQTCVLYIKKSRGNSQKCVYVDRVCHKSVLNSLLLCGIEPTWFFPEDKAINEKIKKDMPCALIVTSVDYYGKFRLTETVVEACREINCLVVCDNSHGTHLAFWDKGKRYPLRMGADLSIDSAHKTIPAVTGGAYLNVSRETMIDIEELRECMSVFGSTSPSYLIMQSLDWARSYMELYGRQCLAGLEKWIINLRNKCLSWGISVYDLTTHDMFRITLCVEKCNFDGFALYKYLYDNGVVCEMADKHHVVLISSVCDSEDMYKKLETLIESFVAGACTGVAFCGEIIGRKDYKAKLPERVLALDVAFFGNLYENIDITKAVGRISGKMYAPYPPGVPVIMPGERFDKEVVESLEGYFEQVDVIINQ